MKLPKYKGFTIIEVIIVLVIGAVIMIAVFVVVPQLQRTQRNTNRQNAARRVKAAVEEVYSKTGSYPNIGTSGVTGVNCPTNSTLVVNGTCAIITDITGDVNVAAGSGVYSVINSTPIPDVNKMYIRTSTNTSNGCSSSSSSSKLVNTGAVAGKFAIAVAQETNAGPTADTFCISTP